MERIVKKTREVGTSAGVLLPRSWLNKQVVVTILDPTIEEIIKKVVEIILDHKFNEEVKGVYLYGSYARGDNDSNSDIDILIITQKTNKLINIDNYEILLVNEENFSKNLLKNLNYLSFLRECEVIFNKELIEKYKLSKLDFNSKLLLDEVGRILKINNESVELCMERKLNIPDGIVYSIVLRLRELFILKCFNSKKKYNKAEFLRVIGNKFYSSYLRVKRNEKNLNDLTAEEVYPLIKLSEKWLRELKE